MVIINSHFTFPYLIATIDAWETHWNWHTGTDGGKAHLAFHYLKNAGGQESESNYPYQIQDFGKANKCSFDSSLSAVSITNTGILPDSATDDEIKKVLYNKGPV